MAIKAVARPADIRPGNTHGTFQMTIQITGLVDPWPDHFVVMDDVSPNLAAALLEEEMKNAVKNHLIANHGYTFGLLDSVLLIGATL